MNILLGKFGQKIIFNRDSKECDRSNTNGNVGTYLLFKLLIENNKNDTFYVASDNDLGSFIEKPFENVIDVSDMTYDEMSEISFDAMLVLSGLTRFEKNDRFINIVKNLNTGYILLSDDPRCLDSVLGDDRVGRKPDLIISQFAGDYTFNGKTYEVMYVPIERASCYQCEINYPEDKNIDMVIASNTSGKEYDRVKELASIIKGVPGLDIYGRLTEEERELLGEDNCKGEIKYTEMQNLFRKSFSTFIVPIRKGWVTSKYVESLMNGVLPIFHKDYDTTLLESSDLFIVHDKKDFIDFLEFVKNEKVEVKKLVNKWVKIMIEPHVDGKILSRDLMTCVRYVKSLR